MSTERNTHFEGFAKLLYYELASLKGNMPPHLNDADWIRAEQTLIAQHAYDLVRHTIDHLSLHDFEPYTYEVAKEERIEDDDLLSHIPDLTQWPDSYTNE